MDKHRFSNIVVSLKNVGPIGKEIQINGTPTLPLQMIKGIPDPRGIVPFNKILQQFNPHIIQCWLYHANLFGILFKYKTKIMWNIRCSQVDMKSYGLIYRLTVKLGAFFSSFPLAVISNSITGKETHERLGYHPNKWEIVPNGFDTNLFRPDFDARKNLRSKLGIPLDAVVIGRVARYDPTKDYENFFKAAHMVLSKFPKTHFIVVGKGVRCSNADFMKSFGNKLTDNIHLMGEVDDMFKIYASVDIVCSASFGEGFPNNIGEAMATGVPCVVTDVGDSARIVNGTGIVVPPKDPEALALALESLLNGGSDVIENLGKRARSRIDKYFNLESMTQKYEEIYQNYA